MKAALSMTQPPQRDEAAASALANASANASRIATTNANVGEPQPIRASDDTPPVTNEQSEKLLQQFMKWQQKPAQ
jgi:hypothetical protein